jgi:hypothetical protein
MDEYKTLEIIMEENNKLIFTLNINDSGRPQVYNYTQCSDSSTDI